MLEGNLWWTSISSRRGSNSPSHCVTEIRVVWRELWASYAYKRLYFPFCKCVVPQNIHTCHTEGIFIRTPHPSRNSNLTPYISSIFFFGSLRTPKTPGISNPFCKGVWFFLWNCKVYWENIVLIQNLVLAILRNNQPYQQCVLLFMTTSMFTILVLWKVREPLLWYHGVSHTTNNYVCLLLYTCASILLQNLF